MKREVSAPVIFGSGSSIGQSSELALAGETHSVSVRIRPGPPKMKRDVSAPKLCVASSPERLPRIGQHTDGGFVVTVNEETLQYTVRRFVEGQPQQGIGPNRNGSTPSAATGGPPSRVAPVPLRCALGEGGHR